MTQENDIKYPDIEIYLADISNDEIINWLSAPLSDIKLTRSSPKFTSWRYTATWASETGPIEVCFMVIENSSQNFTSLWFQTSQLPWPTDLLCARAASKHFSCEVRCAQGSWSPDQDPDEWLSIQGEKEALITWRS